MSKRTSSSVSLTQQPNSKPKHKDSTRIIHYLQPMAHLQLLTTMKQDNEHLYLEYMQFIATQENQLLTQYCCKWQIIDTGVFQGIVKYNTFTERMVTLNRVCHHWNKEMKKPSSWIYLYLTMNQIYLLQRQPPIPYIIQGVRYYIGPKFTQDSHFFTKLHVWYSDEINCEFSEHYEHNNSLLSSIQSIATNTFVTHSFLPRLNSIAPIFANLVCLYMRYLSFGPLTSNLNYQGLMMRVSSWSITLVHHAPQLQHFKTDYLYDEMAEYMKPLLQHIKKLTIYYHQNIYTSDDQGVVWFKHGEKDTYTFLEKYKWDELNCSYLFLLRCSATTKLVAKKITCINHYYDLVDFNFPLSCPFEIDPSTSTFHLIMEGGSDDFWTLDMFVKSLPSIIHQFDIYGCERFALYSILQKQALTIHQLNLYNINFAWSDPICNNIIRCMNQKLSIIHQSNMYITRNSYYHQENVALYNTSDITWIQLDNREKYVYPEFENPLISLRPVIDKDRFESMGMNRPITPMYTND